MNNEELIKLRNEIMDCFTCDEEIMEGGDSVIESRIDVALANYLKVSKELKSLFKFKDTVIKNTPKQNWFGLEVQTGAINGFYTDKDYLILNTEKLRKKYKGSEWLICNKDTQVGDFSLTSNNRFTQDAAMQMILSLKYPKSRTGSHGEYDFDLQEIETQGYNDESDPNRCTVFMRKIKAFLKFNNVAFTKGLPIEFENKYPCFYGDNSSKHCVHVLLSSDIEQNEYHYLIIRWSENYHPVLSRAIIRPAVGVDKEYFGDEHYVSSCNVGEYLPTGWSDKNFNDIYVDIKRFITVSHNIFDTIV
jgi:hypothetical protein